MSRFTDNESRTTMLLQAHAKINWTLEILGKRPDGYHELKSIVLPVALHDDIEIAEGATLEPSDFPYGEKDLAYRAVKRMQAESARALGARFKLVKRIPAGGGLGGGSADAAVVINGLNEFWALGLSEARRLEIAAEIGSDVPALVMGGPVMMEGRGERVRRLTAAELTRVPSGDRIELLMPAVFSSTAAVYGEYRATDHGLGRNDLQPAALRLYPEIGAALAELQRRGLADVAMSGSGSTVYGVKPD